MGVDIRQGYMMIIYVMPEQVGAKSQWSKANDIDIVRIYFIYTSNLHFIYMNGNDIMLSIKIIKNQLLEEL